MIGRKRLSNRKMFKANEDKLPAKWRMKPDHLRGREIGYWYRDRQKRMNRKTGTETDPAVMRKKKCFAMSFNPESKNTIKKYLNSAEDELEFLSVPLSQCKRLKVEVDHSQDHSNTDRMDTSSLPSSSSQPFIKVESNSECSPENPQDCKYSSMERPLNDALDSMNKYKHLEENAFKKEFFSLLSSNVQNKLQEAEKKPAVSILRIAPLDEELYRELSKKERSTEYQKMLKERQELPAFRMQDAILNLMKQNQVLLISGETGCGKTTQVAQFILDEAIRTQNGSLCNIICTQPRRICATSVAERVCDERVETLGRGSVGYQIRLEKKIGRHRGAILYCTTGILLQFMQADPALLNYSHIILDEIHERDTLCDFVMAILKDIALKRKNLKIILMSATFNAERFSNYFGDCPHINIPGYMHPVQEFYLEDVLLFTKYRFPWGKKKNKYARDKSEVTDSDFIKHVLPYAQSLRDSYPDFVIQELSKPQSEEMDIGVIVELVKYICVSQRSGAILVFVPGWEDISAVVRRMNEQENFFHPSSHIIIPLHSLLPSACQQNVFNRPRRGVRKIIIATNIAETSITINDVVYVIDCGKAKIKNYDVARNISTLKPEFVSYANTQQRKGRAGRVQSGVCYHLFSRGRESIMDDYPLPEMLRTRPEEIILRIKLLQLGKASPFLQKVLDPPDPKAVSQAILFLDQMNALDENENLTPLGFHLAKLPIDPQLGKMLLMSVIMSCLNPILSIASILSFKDPFVVPMDEEYYLNMRKLELDKGYKSDHLIMAEVMDRWEQLEGTAGERSFCARNYLNRNILRQLCKQKSLFAQYLVDMGFLTDTNYKQTDLNVNSDNTAVIKAVICSGLYPNVAIIKRQIPTSRKKLLLLRTCEDGKVNLHPKSVNNVQTTYFEDCFLVYREKVLSSSILIHDTTLVSALPILLFSNDINVSYKGEKVIVELNEELRFICDPETLRCITELRQRLYRLVEYKLSHPDQILWKNGSVWIALLRILPNLFTNGNDLIVELVEDRNDD